MPAQEKQQLDKFYQLILQVGKADSAWFDMGMVVPTPDYKLEEVYPAEDFEELYVNEETDSMDFLEKFVAALENGKWALVILETSKLPESWYDIMRQLSVMSRADVKNFRGAESYSLIPSDDSRVIVYVTDPVLEEISINTFLSVFGPIIRL